MNALEWVAAALGLVNVTLVVRRSVWNYPFGLVTVESTVRPNGWSTPRVR